MQTKLKSRKWRSLVSSILLAASASSILIAPVFAAEYTEPLTGVVKDDKAIIKADGNKVSLNKTTNTITYDFQGQDHTFTIKNSDGIATNTDGGDHKYVFNNVGADGSKGTIHIYQSNTKWNPFEGVNGFVANGSTTTVNSNLDITATADYASVGVAVSGNGTLIINGNVKMRKDDAENPWGIITDNVHGNVGPGGKLTMDNGYDAKYTGARWQPSAFSVGYTRGHITVNGDVDVAVRGTAVNVGAYSAAEGVHPYDLATISLVGDSTRIITPYREKNSVEGFGEFTEPYYSLACYGGTINVNVKNMEAQKGKVEIVGNIMAMKRSEYTHTSDVYQDSRINLALTTADSSWKGIIDNANMTKSLVQTNPNDKNSYKYDPDATPVYADHSGEVNLWLQNGAQWIYENASRKDGLDYSHMPQYSQPSYGNYDGMSHLSRLVGGKDSASAGIIRVNDSDPIQIAEAEGVTKVWYEHADATPGTIIGGDVKVLNAKTGTEMMLYTGNNGITKGLAEGDAAADKNNVSEVLNSLAHKLWYMAGDSNLKGSVSIAEGLTASSATMKTGNITFAEGGQGFYDYTPEKDDKPYETGPVVKSENIDETRVGDVNGVVSINVTEAQDSVAASAPSAMYVAGDAVSPLVVDLQGHTLKLNTSGDAKKYLSTVYVDADKSMEIKDSKGNGVLKVSTGLGADGNADTVANYVYGIRVSEGGSFTADTNVEIDGVKSNSKQRAYGVYVSTKGNVVFEKDLSIKNVQTGNKVGANTAGIYADSSSSADAPINITVKGNLNIENVAGSAIRVLNSATVSTAGATIKAADMANGTEYSQYYALQANKGTINLNTGEGITAGILDVTGDMKVTDNKASVINVNMTKGSQWTGAVSNIPSSTYNAPAGQFNLTMAEGSVWNHETGRSVDTLKTTFAGSNVSKLDGSGVIYQNSDKGITVYNYSGDTTVVYGHDANNPQNITGGDFTVKTAAAGSKITLVTDSQGITGGFEDSDTAAEKNNVKEVLNKLANKLFYTGYKDANLSGVVKIADGLTASSVSASVKASGDITFSDGSNGTKKAGQGFYDYTPEQEKPNYKTGAITKSEDISLSRELDASGVAHVTVTESNAGNNKFASAIYAGESTSPSSPMTVKMSGKGLALNAAQSSGQAAAIYAGANTYIKVINPSADQKLSIRATNTDTKGSHGIYALGNAHLNISGPVEITEVITKGDAATGINIQGQQSEINIDGPLTISNVKGLRERGAGMSASGILVTGDSSTVTVSGLVDISGVRGSGIKLVGANTKVSVGGGTITAAEDSDKSHNFYAVRVDKGTLDINMKDDAAGDTTTKITGDMYATGQYGKKVVEYSGGELIDWKDAGILNVALTDKDSFWKGVAAYDMYNDDYGTGGNTTHDIGQFNLYLQNGATWTNEQQSHVTTTTIASKNPVWEGSTLATLHGGKDAAHAGHIFQNDSNNLTIVNYSGNTNIYYAHEGNGEAAENYKAGDTIIKSAAAGSEVSLITDNTGITMSNDSSVANVLNALAGKLTYSNFATGEKNLVGYVKIAGGLTASSAALRTENISFNEEGKGFYGTPEAADMAFTTTLTGSASSDAEYAKAGVIQTDGSYKFTKDASITMAKGASAISLSKATLINAEDNKLNLSTEGSVSGKVNAIKHNIDGALTINAGELNVTAVNNQEFGGVRAIEINSDNKSVKPNAVINAKVNVKAEANNGNAYGLYSENGSTLTVNNDVVMNSGNEDEWAVNGKVYNGTLSNSSAAVFVKGGKATEVNINGNVDLAVNAHGLMATGENGVINVNGGNIKVNQATNGLYAIAALDSGTVNMNVANGAAGANDVNINGNIGVIAGMMGSIGMSTADVNLGLGTDKSVLNGVIYNSFDSADGKANLYLQNGATWNNASWGNIINDEDSLAFAGSHVTKFVGGSDKAHAGNIFQNDTNKLTIDNYSGNTNIYYAHEGNGEAAADYKAGDTVIKSAAAGSSVSLITDNKNVDMTDNNSVGSVLNALAGKLTYSNFASGEKNLLGYVKIADGLTASSAALKTGDISFDKAGKGFYDYTPEDSSHMVDPITGNLDKKYVKFGIETEKGIYNFTQDTTIDVTKGDYSSNLGAIESSGGPITINADGYNLDVAYHVLKGSNVARAVATGLRTGIKDVTIKAKSLKLSTDTTGFYGQGVYATGGKITIDADTTISTSAQTESNGIYAGSGGTVTMNGNLDIQKDSKAANYIALKSDDNGVINVNMKDGKAGTGIVKIDGDVFTKSAESYDYWEDETTTTSSTVNLALQGKDSSWNGRSLYKVTPGDESTDYGVFNLWLADGATWTNEKNGKVVPSGFTGSRVTKFTGGSDAAHAGNIFQNDTKNITIENYSGNTNIYYAHTGNGEAAGDYKAGDTIIKHAEKDSVVSLITDNKDVNMNSADSIVNVLNSLAGKLTYSNFTKNENNLTGYVKIADGLTSSSAAMYTGDMAFSKKDGKGSLKDEDSIRPDLPAPDHQIKNEFTTTLTGVKANDKEYYKAGVIKGEGLYQFTENSSITTTNAHGADMNQATTIDATGKTLTFNTNVTSSSTIHAIGANSTDGVTITADKLVLNAHSTKGRVEAINVGGQGQQNKDKPMKLTINGDTEMNVKGINYSLGLYAAGNSEVTFNGNVTAMGDENSEWGLTSKNGAFGYYGCSLVYSGSNYTLQTGPKVTINGDVNAKIDGNCLFANGGHAKLTINGGGNIEINKNNEHTYYAMMAESATTSMNVNLDENYDAVSARDNKLVLKGNVGASTGAMNANEPELYTKVNLGLATADSVWTGVAHNGFKDEGNKAGDKTFYGAINVFLQNGATWNNEKWGETSKPWGGSGFTGSHVAKFVGGSDAAHAGNIFQNDANNITIDNYSGNTNIYYAHTGNGEAADNYAAGDTIIRSAAEGSVVSLITDNSGISMDNEYSVANVLNTLAGKLTYSSFVNGEKNLAGYVKIADGLTASSAAKQTGNIAFNTDTGKGSLENGSMKPGFTYPETQVPESNKLKQGITGDAKADYQYKKDGILKEDGSYVFTQDPTKIEVESGAAVSATKKNINIDTTKAKLELKGETGINANGADVTVKGNTNISGNVGINAANGNVTLNGSTVISGTDAAINAGTDGNVDINTNNSALNIKGDINANGGNITVDSGNATGIIDGNVTAANGGNVEISLNDAQSKLTGSYNADEGSSIVMNVKNGAVWELTDDDDEAAGMSLLRMAKAPAAAAAKGLTVNGGETKAKTGYLNMTKRTKDLKIASYSGWETIIYAHENAGSKDEDYKNGNTIINKAAKDSGVILSTDNSGINMNDKAAVEATLKALAHKVSYTDHKANGGNLTGMVQIADGLTASSASKYLGNMSWDENGKGQYVEGSVNWKEIYNGDYETLVMKGVRSAATTSMHSWRDNMQDTYTGADLADADGIFAKALGGKTSSDVKGVRDDNTYRGVQVGFDKVLANGWHAGAAFDYRNGDSNYLLGGKGDNQLYSFGVYGVKNFEDQSYLRVAAKAGRVENEYDVYNEIRTLKLHGDYKSNAYGLTMEYGKTFGTEASYFTPKAQLTWSQVGAKDYTAHTPNDSMRIDQDAYSSLVARFGVEAGAKSEKGRVYVGLYGAHEFNGDISASYFAKDGGIKHTSFDGKDTWMEMSIGGSYDLSDNCHIYADFAKDFKGDFERKWKLNAGLRFEF